MATPPTAPALPAVTPLAGTTTVDDKMTFEPVRLSYKSAGKLAQRIADAAAAWTTKKQVVIAEASLLTQFSNLQSFYISLDDIAQDYEALSAHAGDTQIRLGMRVAVERDSVDAVTPLAQPLVQPVVAAVNAALGLASLFRTDVDFHGVAAPLDALAFELSLAGHLVAQGAKTVFVPALMYIAKPDDSDGSILSRIHKLQQAKGAAWQAAGPLISRLVSLEGDLDDAVTAKDQDRVDQLSSEVSALRRDLDPLSAALARSDQRLADLQKAWLDTDKDTGLTALASMLRAEAIQKMDVVFLHAAVVSSGGHNRISRNLFRTLFAGDGLSFLGGVTVRWALLGRDGSVTNGGILSHSETGTFPSPLLRTLSRWLGGEEKSKGPIVAQPATHQMDREIEGQAKADKKKADKKN
jgi:hypothetical protein